MNRLRTLFAPRLFAPLLLALALVPICRASVVAPQATPLKVLATMPTYGALAQEFGGDQVDVVTLVRPGQDPHGFQATPSIMARARHADLLLATGLDAEAWLDGMLRSTDNTHLLPGSPQSLAMSDGITLKEVPSVVSRSGGDIHAFGNPHVWADPLAVRSMAERIADALAAALPEHADEIQARHAAFHQRLTAALVRWITAFRALKGQGVVVYHPSWIYLLDRLGVQQIETIEPKPRVAPTASHLEEVIATMKARDVKVILREPYNNPDAAEFVAERTGATVLTLATMPGWTPGTDDVLAYFDISITALHDAMLGKADSGS